MREGEPGGARYHASGILREKLRAIARHTLYTHTATRARGGKCPRRRELDVRLEGAQEDAKVST